jgi:hypothetical protein
MAEALTARRLAALATAGVALTFVVVAASALLRLGTALDAGGNAASRLPATVEATARLVHRISASGVGIAALAAAIVAFASRPVPRARLAAIGAIVVLTGFLAAIGRYTPGYRFLPVTVGNALGGIALACAFMWLRMQATRSAGIEGRTAVSRAATLALAIALVQAGVGTASSALAMHGVRTMEPWHVASGFVVAGIAVAVAVYRYREAGGRAARAWIFALALAQMALGFALAAADAQRGIPGAWAHAMLACALALALTALAARGR